MTGATLLVLPAGIPWVLAAVLALADGRKRWVGLLATAGLGASLVSLTFLATKVLQVGPVEIVAGGSPVGVVSIFARASEAAEEEYAAPRGEEGS